MKPEKWVQNLKQRMGSPPLKLNTSDETIDSLIEQSIDMITPYLRVADHMEASGPQVDMSEQKPLVIMNVYPTTGMLPATAFGHVDTFSLINYAAFSGMRESLQQITARNIYRSELQALIPEDYKLIDNTLYLSGYVGPVTIEYIGVKTVEKMPESYQNWLFRYSLALLRETEGEIRSKVKIEGSPVELNGEALKQQGEREREALEGMLGKEISAFIITR